jgi:protein-disulfide isomerase
MSESLGRLSERFPKDVQIVFKNYPIDSKCNRGMLHPQGCDLAVLGRCLGGKGKFWDFHDLVYSRQRDITDASIVAWAEELGLSRAEIHDCLSSSDHSEKIKQDIKTADTLGLQGTPMVFINKRLYQGGPSIEQLTFEVETLLGK